MQKNLKNNLIIPPKVLGEIKRLQFRTRKFITQGLSGRYKSAFKGQGIEFEEVRKYLPGDEIRAIDWKVTSRIGEPYVKSFREERELTVMIAVDVSSSTLTGSLGEIRERVIAQIGSVLTLIALRNQDNVGLVTFSDKVESYYPPKKTRQSVWRILREVLRPREGFKHTNISELCIHLGKILKRHAVIFIISDFIGDNFWQELKILKRKHQVTLISIKDNFDFDLPKLGLIQVYNPESGENFTIDSSNPQVTKAYREEAIQRYSQFLESSKLQGIDVLECFADKEFMPVLSKYFSSKSKR